MDCEHFFHRQCGEVLYIMREGTKYPTCHACNITIELTREELAFSSGQYIIQKKRSEKSDDTVEETEEELLTSLGIIEDSHARQGSQSNQIATQDQATSPIVIVDDVSVDNDDNR